MKDVWISVKEEFVKDTEQVLLGKYLSKMLYNDPKLISFLFSKYKFASKIIGKNKDVLELGCCEGYGTLLLAETANSVTGIDFDSESIDYANKTFQNEKIKFIYGDFLEYTFDRAFDAVISFDVIEHISEECENLYVETICKNLNPHGIAVVSTPNINAYEYASPSSKKWHINNYSYDRLLNLFENYFHNVMLFSRNDEIIHTGFYPLAHHFIVIGISPK